MVNRKTSDWMTNIANVASGKTARDKKFKEQQAKATESFNVQQQAALQRETTQSTAPPSISKPEVIRSEDTGNVTAVRMPDGRVILGNARDVDLMINKSPTPAGTIEATQGAAQREQQAQNLSAVETARTQQQPIQEGEAKPVNWLQAAGAGVGGAASGVIGGAVAGLATGGAATIPLAVVGGVGTAIAGIRSNIAQQISGNIKSGKATLGELKSAQNEAISAVKRGEDAAFWSEQFYLADSQIRKLAADAKKEETRWLATFTGKDAEMALTEYEVYFSRTFPTQERQLMEAAAAANMLPQNI